MRLVLKHTTRLAAALTVATWALAAPAATDPPKPPTSMQKEPPKVIVPDVSFQEVEMFYPDLNLAIRLVPPGGNANTSILKLVQNPTVPPGTSLGPAEPSGQPGPVAWRSCSTPLKAKLRVFVTNGGNGAFDATTTALGLTGKIDATPVSSAFGKVPALQTKQFEAGAFSLSKGTHSASLLLNKAKGGLEVNFANNGHDSRFEITCTVPSPPPCPPGQVVDPLTGACVTPKTTVK